MKYQATIHTMEIEPILGTKYQGKPGKWVQEMHKLNHPCVSSYLNHNDNSARAVINTHRMNTTPEGKYIFSYKPLSDHMRDMQTICGEIGIDGYIIKRMDVCLDTDAPYSETQKLTRLIALMLAEKIGANNRYKYDEPMTLESKALYLENGGRDVNGNKIYPTHSIEHYNRELVNQMNYAGEPVRNRFELRSMGRAAGVDHSEGDIVAGWMKRLDGLTRRDMEHVQQQLNQMILRECGNYLHEVGNQSSTEINAFLKVCGADHIYSRRQLKEILDMLGVVRNETYTSNLLSRAGERFKLYSWADVRTEIGEMKAALQAFFGGGRMSQK